MGKTHCVKNVCSRSFSGPYIPAFELNTEIYSVNLCIQSKCGKIQTRKTPNTITFHAVILSKYITAFNYIGKTLLVLSATSGGVSIASFATVIGTLVGIKSASFILVFSVVTKLKKKIKNKKKIAKRNTKKLF